jgi:hypothetical protein
MSPTTTRLYAAAQRKFRAWCTDTGRRFPTTHEAVALYLRTVMKTGGPSSVHVHLAALAMAYRDAGRGLDTRHPAIQRVTAKARTSLRR